MRLGHREYTQRPDKKYNIWQYRYHLPDDLLPRWVLVGVVKHLNKRR